MRKSVYLETTVVSYLTARPSRDLIRELWSRGYVPPVICTPDALMGG